MRSPQDTTTGLQAVSGFRTALLAALRERSDPVRAEQQQRYMKSNLPYFGVAVPEVRRITRATSRTFRFTSADAWQAAILSIWRSAERREELYSAVELLNDPTYRAWLSPDRIDLIQELVVTGAWWDLVDGIASHATGRMLAAYRAETSTILRSWSVEEDIWLRRTAILAQLRFKTDTDRTLLVDVIEPSVERQEFFLRKAIGWALREYSKVEPEFVLDYIARNTDRLSPLTRREGLKVLAKQGRVNGATGKD